MFKNPTIHFNALFNPLGNSKCSSAEVVLVFLLYDVSTVHNASDQFVSCVYFFSVHFAFHPSPQKKFWLYAPNSNSCIFTPTENWTHVYMNLLIYCYSWNTLYISLWKTFYSLNYQNWTHVYMNLLICYSSWNTLYISWWIHSVLLTTKIGHMFIWTYLLGIAHTATP